MTNETSPEASNVASRLRTDVETWKNDLRAIAEDVRVQIHLGELEAKEAWSQLQPKVFEFEKKAESLRALLGTELKNVGKELKTAGKDIEQAGRGLKDAGQDLKQAGASLKSELVRLRDRLVKS